MPLVLDVAEQRRASGRRLAARKIKPEYAEGPLVKVAHVETQPEAEFIGGMLLEEGIPSVLSGSISGYAPVLDGRDVLVPESGAEAARELLAFDQR